MGEIFEYHFVGAFLTATTPPHSTIESNLMEKAEATVGYDEQCVRDLCLEKNKQKTFRFE